ncbi:MAG TPA: CYTH domain-containing protein [Chthoniobacterales bacterium]
MKARFSNNGKVAREIERKFLLKRLPPKLRQFRSRAIEQGYLSVKSDGTQIRLRKAGRRHSLTIKLGGGLSRQEIEVDLTRDQFEALWPATAGFRLTKTRYDVPFGKHTVEIDVYRGRNEGLVVAEVEFTDERECRRFQPPDWFAADVSGKSRYSNVRLARE